MEDNKFLELISSPLMNLDHTYRYSGTKLVESESLSQHIVDCIMMGLRIIDQLHEHGEIGISAEHYVMKAVYHDLEEVITGDVPRPLKYYDEDTHSSLEKVANNVAAKFFSTQFIDSSASYDLWKDAKKGTEGYILKLVDNLVVANKVIKEVNLLHNYYMLRVAHEVVQYTHHLLEDLQHNPRFNSREANYYLEEILEGSIYAMNHIIEQNKDIMESLHISGQSMI